MKQTDLRILANASKSVCTWTIAVSTDPLSPTPSTSSAMKIAEKTEEHPDGPEWTDEGHIEME
jgi:hypothetical protein